MEPLELENNLKTDVELLKKDVHSIAKLVDKLDVAIDKLTEVTNCLNKMIAVQEQKIEQQEQDDVYIKEKTKELSRRVTSLEKWKWLTLGGAGVVGFILAKLSMISQIIS
jgi:peptidoglycan hydrolase CwlO-like protein